MVSAIFKDFGAWGVKSAYSTLTTQASNVSFTAIDYTQFTASWNNGNGSKRAAFIKQGSGGSAVPVNASTYTASTTFGLGTQIGLTGWYCIYNGTGTSVTVDGLSIGTSYRVFVAEYNGVDGSSEYLTSLATANPKNQSTNLYGSISWNGSVSTNWNTDANWSLNTIPTAYYDVTVPLSGITNFPVVFANAPGSCHNLTIESGASLTVQSNVSGTGSLITTGTVTGNMTIERFVAGNSLLTANVFHLVSIPLHPDNVSLSNLFLGSYLYEYLPATNAWHGMGTTTTAELDETEGYMIYYPNTSKPTNLQAFRIQARSHLRLLIQEIL